MNVEDSEFEALVAEAIDQIPKVYKSRLENVAFLIEDEPSPEQRRKLSLHSGESLFGLYEGVPLPQRGGATKLLPDKITVFKKPMLQSSHDRESLKQQIRQTIWHEVAHFYGLNHERIHEIEDKHKR
ncbi:MAG: zn-dependent protease [Candidatus Saccharibacteria bacterium]|nr:zn-dependent protease [Candidatus Saccharibacteria bacterium]